ncbi:MAG: hypothetical protein ABI686_15260, partial [Acidobacteriota bacterium]
MENGKRKIKTENRRKYFLFSIFRFFISSCAALLIFFGHWTLDIGHWTQKVSAQKRNALGWVWQNPLPQGNPLYAI